MTIHGSSRGRLLLILLAVLGAALVSVLALLQGERPARADEQKEAVHQIALERDSSPAFQHKLNEAASQSQGDFEAEIVGGTSVPNGKYPFMTALSITNTDGTTGHCGGALIDPDSVLTAAHCLTKARSVNLAIGRTVRSQNQGQLRFATDGFIHNLYRGQDNRYDAGVLKLNRAVTGINPIKLATARQNNLETPGRNLTVAGWGTTSESGSTADRMREVSVPVVSDARAQDAYASIGVPSMRYFPSLMVAAGAKGKDSCQGDSGGPLFKPTTTRAQVGIVSYGLGCARAGFPGAYTEVNNPDIRKFIVAAAGR